MATLPILIQHGGRWDSNNRFIDYSIEGVVISTETKFIDFVSTISKQLMIDTTINLIEIHERERERYVFNQNEENSSVCLQIANTYDIHNGDTLQLIAFDNVDDPEVVDFDKTPIIDDPLNNTVSEGQLYKDKETLMIALKNYAIQKKFQFKVDRSSPSRYFLVCVNDRCTWFFKSSSLNKSKIFRVRKFSKDHTCLARDRLFTQRVATAPVIGRIICDKYVDPKTIYTAKDIMKDMKKHYGIDLSYWKANRSKQKAFQFLRGDPSESYAKLPSYLYMLMHSNPGSVVCLRKSDEEHFMYAFVALYASIKGWEFCKPIVVVDGSFLKATYRGMLLTACSQDAGGKIFSLAYAIVDKENDASWGWFFERFKEALGDRDDMCIVSDRNESIAKAASIVYPQVSHCVCIWHLWNNIKDRYKRSQEELREIFFATARAYTIQEFNHHMTEMEQIDGRVKDYLFDIWYHRWSRAHAKVNRTMTMTSNIAESLNSATKEARELPIQQLLEEIRKLINRWNYTNRNTAQATFTKLTFKYNAILDENLDASQHMMVRPSTENLHSVIDNGRLFIVCLRERTCSCRRFQLDQIPCPHAWAVLRSKNLEGEDYCSMYYSNEYMLKAYDIPIYPLPDESTWTIPVEVLEQAVLPPVWNKMPGRPKKVRYKKVSESQAKRPKSSCGQCGHESHNRRTCRNIPYNH
ncbi:uncharacterized protein LOC142180943 [Nicotiana tabacum]|uniref:Uncharacterized protein LOC142180943 n=1 Tax=Nicotiana tabacum TaxID=4097 RepID=A0AC58UI40_TOBAC